MKGEKMSQLVNKKKILLAFSGGLDTSAIVPWLKETYSADVYAYCSDLGNSPDGESLKEWAIQLGASEFIFEDLKEDFVSRFAFPAVRAGATYQDDYLLGTALGRPLIAERMAHHAKRLGVSAVAHGCTGKGNDQIRFEKSWAYLIPDLEIIAPWRVWDFRGRADLLKYLNERGFKLEAKEKKYSEDVNLFHRSCEGGILENPSDEFDANEIYKWVKPLQHASSDYAQVEISFEKGIPVAMNQQKLAPAALLSQLNWVAGEAGVGVQDIVEERANGIKSRGVYETPGGAVLHVACRALKHLCWDRSLMNTARYLGVQYGEAIYDGLWHSDLRSSIESFFEKAADTLTGTVMLKLDKGTVTFVSRKSEYSLYNTDTVTFEADEIGVHKLADGFCKITALKQRQAGSRDQKTGRLPKELQ
jgi:argininosuccinate synthase